MIARILYRKSVQGVLNYVFGKEGRLILGFQNSYSEFDTDTRLFGHILYGLGQRKKSPKRYAHITLNLPHGERLDDLTFYTIAKEYMQQMGYAMQPYVVVRHDDTKHQHIHIVSTTITDDGGSINLSHDYRRNVATQKYLEKKFGLSPSPETRSERQLPIHRLPELQFSMDDSNGNRFYLQEVLNSTLQKYKVRGIEELKVLIKPYHIVIKKCVNENGRLGVAFGLNNQKHYKTRFIDGYQVHPKLSGPKLKAVFEYNRKSKLLPMHKKRLEKQLETALKLFESIRYEDLPDILQTYQNIDSELYFGKRQQLSDLIIYDKSGYVFNGSEIGLGTDLMAHPKLTNNDRQTQINTENGQFLLEVRKLIKNAFYESYLGTNKSNMLLSEFVMTKNLRDMLPVIAKSGSYAFLSFYSSKNNGKVLLQMLRQEFEGTRNDLHCSEVKREMTGLEKKAALLQKLLDLSVFDTDKNPDITFFLLQGLGLKFANGQLSYINSNIHALPMGFGRIGLPKTNASYLSTGFINQNEKVLEMLTGEANNKNIGILASSFFLPLMLPELYSKMSEEHLKKFEELSLKVYHQKSEQFNMRYEKSPVDYIKLFNAKGFYFERIKDGIHIGCIYSKSSTTIPLAPKTQAYLNSIQNLDSLLSEQQNTIGKIQDNAQGQLKNLWASYLIELQLYDKAAYMMVYEGVQPVLHIEAMEQHMERGLREKVLEASEQKINTLQSSLLRKSVYAFSSLLGASGYKNEEVYNGFKDELTDYSKYRGVFL